MADFKLILCDIEERQIHDESGEYNIKELIAKHEIIQPKSIFVNGEELKRPLRYRPKDGDEILFFMGSPGVSDVWEAVAGVGAVIGGAFLMTVSPIWGIAAIGVGLGLLSSAISTDSTSATNTTSVTSGGMSDVSGSSASTIAGHDMSANSSGKVPLILGSFAYRPDLIANPYLTCDNNTATVYNNILACVGYDDDLDTITIDDIHVVDEDAENITGVSLVTDYQYVVPKKPGASFSPTQSTDDPTPVNLVSSVMSGEHVTAIKVMVLFTSGLYANTSTGVEGIGVVFRGRVFDDNDNATSVTWTKQESIVDAFYYEVTVPNSAGKRKFILDNIQFNSYSVNSSLIGTVSISQIAWYMNKTAVHNNALRVLGIKYPNTIAIDGNSMKITADLRSNIRNVETLTKEVTPRCGGNPADIILYVATGENTLGSRRYTDDRIDLDSFEEFRAYCEARNYRYNAPVFDGRGFHELILHAALIGHARIQYNSEGNLAVLIDDNFDANYQTMPLPVVCTINSTNTILDSWQITKSNIDYSLKNTILRIMFIDDSINAESVSYIFLDSRRYYNSDGSLKTFEQVLEEIDYDTDVIETISLTTYEGIRNPDMIYEMGRREILKRWYTNREVSFTMAVQHNGIAIWDRVWLNHRLLANTTIEGKILSISGNTVVLDRPIQEYLDSMLDDGINRYIALPKSSMVINHIDTEGDGSFCNIYTITEIVNSFTIKIDIPTGDPLLFTTIGKYDTFSIADGYADMVVISKKPSDNGLFAEVTCTDYLFDESCRAYIDDPVAMYNNVTKYKYGNPYMTYLETVPNHYTNGTIE